MPTTYQTTDTTPDAEIQARLLGLMDLAKARGSKPPAIPKQQVAPMNSFQKSGMARAASNAGIWSPYMQRANALSGQSANAFTGASNYATNNVGGNVDLAQGYMDDALAQGAGQGAGALGIAGLYGDEASMYAGQGGQQVVDPARMAAGIGNYYAQSGAQGYDPNSVQNFMNPWQQLNTSYKLSEMNRAANPGRQMINAQAAGLGAFGGSRAGIQSAEFERNLQDQQNRVIAQDAEANYGQAQQAAMQSFQNEMARRQQAGQTALQGGQMVSNAGLGSLQLGANTALQNANTQGQLGMNYANMLQTGGLQAGAGLGTLGMQGTQIATNAQMDAAKGLGTLAQNQALMGGMASQYGANDAQLIYNMGANQQKNTQAGLDATYNQQLAKTYDPFQRISWMSDIYRGVPSGSSSITANTTPDPSPLNQAIGAGIAGFGALSAFNKATSNGGFFGS